MIKILVPTDFSKNALNALKYAVAFAKKEKAKIILVHAYHQSLYVASLESIDYSNQIIDELEKFSNIKLEQICNKVIKAEKISCTFLSKYGLATDVIEETVKKEKINFVIMGTKGSTALENVIMGSITAKIIGKLTCPVIAVPEKAKFNSIKKITFATDYNNADISELKTLVNIAKPFKAQINLLHIAVGEYSLSEEHALLEKYVKKTTSKIDYNNLSFQLLIGENVQKSLQEYISKKSTSILAISTKKRNIIEKLFGRSLTKKISYHSNIPIIAFHHKKESKIFA